MFTFNVYIHLLTAQRMEGIMNFNLPVSFVTGIVETYLRVRTRRRGPSVDPC